VPTATLSDTARAVLRAATLDGDLLTLPPGQLDRAVYLEVNKALTRIGGKWNRTRKGHAFDRPAAGALAEIVGTGAIPKDADKVMSFWPTPPDVADWLVYQACQAWMVEGDGMHVLEPSAGEGDLAQAVRRRLPAAHITCVEPDPRRVAVLRGTGVADVVAEVTLESFLADHHADPYDLVVMNPPFTLAGRRAAWAEHITAIWEAPGLIRDGGTLAAIVPDNGAMTQDRAAGDKRVRQVRELVDVYGRFEPMEEGSFKAVGTGARTGAVWLEAPPWS
jgi:hypothetical protein